MSQPEKRVRRTREQVEDLLDRFESSEETQGRFAKREDLSVSTLRFWIARRRREAATITSASRFVPVSLPPPVEMPGTGLELEFAVNRRRKRSPQHVLTVETSRRGVRSPFLCVGYGRAEAVGVLTRALLSSRAV